MITGNWSEQYSSERHDSFDNVQQWFMIYNENKMNLKFAL